jgi:hypothetical protein
VKGLITAQALTSLGLSAITLGVAIVWTLIGVLVPLNGYGDSQANPLLLGYVALALAANVTLLGVVNAAIARKWWPHRRGGVATGVAVAALVTMAFALVPLAGLGLAHLRSLTP